MITLQEFLVNNKIKQKYSDTLTTNIKLPEYELVDKNNYEYIYKGDINLEVEDKPIVIYKDRYRNSLHIASFYEMVETIGFTFFSYEDFSEKDIIKGFDTFKEAANYVIEKKLKVCDSKEWLNRALVGDEDYDIQDKPSEIDTYPTFFDALNSWATIKK